MRGDQKKVFCFGGGEVSGRGREMRCTGGVWGMDVDGGGGLGRADIDPPEIRCVRGSVERKAKRKGAATGVT